MDFIQRVLKHTDLLIGFGILVVVAMLIVPLPHVIMDAGLVLALAAAIVILLNAVNVPEPLQFSVFPSLLMLTTLFRLALSVGATKLILGHGDAGNVIRAFGEFVLGGNFVVGFVTFLILMIVQFVVITNGATRVSEVVARFTLDAMPGKQMAIDADLAAGLIDDKQAKVRRKAIKQEADFYGAMDGASKFVKGDAIAAILIVAVNLIGGIAIGLINGQGDIGTVASKYAVLTVGEGLISQIPALLISTAAGLLVTRNGQEAGMGGTVIGQILGQHKMLVTAAGALCVFAFVPGFPTLVFLSIAGIFAGVSMFAKKNPNLIGDLLKSAEEMNQESEPVLPQGPAAGSPEAVMPLLSVDALEIEVGFSLTRLADVKVGGDLSERIAATRTQIATEFGFVMPSVRIRDNALLEPGEYVIKVRGEEIARSEAIPDRFLAILPGGDSAGLTGVPTQEPVFGLPAMWIEEVQRGQAEIAGCTVVEPSAMIATHLSEIVKSHASELLTRQDVNRLLDNLKETNEAVVSAIGPDAVPLGDVQKVLQHLLRERIPIRDLVTILEAVADFGPRLKDVDQLAELVRASIPRTITRQFIGADNKMTCLTIAAPLERTLQESLQNTAGGTVLALEPDLQRQFLKDLREQYESGSANGNPILLCSAAIRLPLKRMVEREIPALPVIAYNEVAASADVEFVGQLQSGQAMAA
ncbi:MAG: flagellar biosynthesis protein FlhA [Fimbriimonadaceae bacterium]|nr:flagellar biosynthesis protein FlhA [Fimbriimonadaceae bacterium]